MTDSDADAVREVVGRRELVALPEWQISRLRAKIDTGARTCALDVDNLASLPDQHVGFEVVGGFLQFHVTPGEVVDRGQPLATNSSILGRELNVLLAPEAGIVIGMSSQPAVIPGNPVCHLAIPDQGIDRIRRALRRQPKGTLHARLRRHLASGVLVSRREQ